MKVNIVADMVADMEVDMVAVMVANMDVDMWMKYKSDYMK